MVYFLNFCSTQQIFSTLIQLYPNRRTSVYKAVTYYMIVHTMHLVQCNLEYNSLNDTVRTIDVKKIMMSPL